MVGRVSSHSLSQSMLQASLNVQSKYANATAQQSSGLVATTYGGLGSQASSLISLETSQTRLNAWSDTTHNANDRVQSMYAAVGDMIDQLSSLRSTISAAMSNSSTATDLNSTGQSLLDDLAGLMNTQLNGRYLFAGSNTDTAPVDTSALTAATVPSTADSSYYTGDSEIASVRVSENQTISYGVTASSTGFEQALRTANIVANMTTSPVDSDALSEAYDLATSAMDALLATQASLSVTSGRLESAQTRQSNALSLLDTMTSNIKDVDVAEVAVRLAEYQTQLTASYSALSSLSKVHLVNYL
jgi:flagellar hook-associated protein 3 FlgL